MAGPSKPPLFVIPFLVQLASPALLLVLDPSPTSGCSKAASLAISFFPYTPHALQVVASYPPLFSSTEWTLLHCIHEEYLVACESPSILPGGSQSNTYEVIVDLSPSTQPFYIDKHALFFVTPFSLYLFFLSRLLHWRFRQTLFLFFFLHPELPALPLPKDLHSPEQLAAARISFSAGFPLRWEGLRRTSAFLLILTPSPSRAQKWTSRGSPSSYFCEVPSTILTVLLPLSSLSR